MRADPVLELNQVTLSSWIRTPMLTHVFTSIKTESVVCTDVYKKWEYHIEHKNHQNLSLKNRFGLVGKFDYNIKIFDLKGLTAFAVGSFVWRNI